MRLPTHPQPPASGGRDQTALANDLGREAGHIPGPWNCCQESSDPEWWIVTIHGGLIVANINAHYRQGANARLIAAAPDLLASLRTLIDAYGMPDNKAREAPILKTARQVVEKATGAA